MLIPVTRSGVFGSSLATAQELANAARIDPGGGQSPAPVPAPAGKSGGIVHLASSTSECFPETQAAADAAKSQIDAVYAATSKEITALLATERRKQSPDASDDSSAVLAQVTDKLCAFYTSQIAPRWAAANNNCPLGEVLIIYTGSLNQQRELLGATGNCTALAACRA